MLPSGNSPLAAALAVAKLTSSGWWVAPCPFCASRTGTPGRGRKLGIRDDTGVYHCFRCGAVGALRGVDARTLRDLGKAVHRPETKDPGEATRPPEGFYSLGSEPGASALAFTEARAYLGKRKVDPAVVAAAGIGACAVGKYAGRVVVPVLADPGAGGGASPGWAGFVARTWGPKDACDIPYLYPAGMPKGVVVYNGAVLHVPTEVPAVIVEGAFDTFPFWPDGVALLGDATEEQVDLLVEARRPLAVVLDGDAWRKGWMLALRLRLEGCRAGAVRLPPRRDPDEVPAQALRDAAWAAVESDDGLVEL